MARAGDSKRKTIDAAVQLFRRQGYNGTGLSEILAAGGAPRGSLYFHFPGGKDEIGLEALAAVGTATRAGIVAAAARASTMDDFLARVVDAMTGHMRESAFKEGCLVAAVTIDAATFSARLAKAASEVFTSWIDELAHGLVRFGSDPASAPELASTILAQLEGSLLLARASQSAAPIDFAKRAVQRLVLAESAHRPKRRAPSRK